MTASDAASPFWPYAGVAALFVITAGLYLWSAAKVWARAERWVQQRYSEPSNVVPFRRDPWSVREWSQP